MGLVRSWYPIPLCGRFNATDAWRLRRRTKPSHEAQTLRAVTATADGSGLVLRRKHASVRRIHTVGFERQTTYFVSSERLPQLPLLVLLCLMLHTVTCKRTLFCINHTAEMFEAEY